MAGTLSVGGSSNTRPAWTESAATACTGDSASAAARRAAELVAQAEGALLQREREAKREHLGHASKRERIEAVLVSALEVLEQENCEENQEAVEEAIEAAQKARVLPELRVKARKYLALCQQVDGRVGLVEDELRRLTVQLERLHAPTSDADDGETSSNAAYVKQPMLEVARTRRREDLVMQQLGRAIEEAVRLGVDEDYIDEAREAIRQVEKDRRVEFVAEEQLRGLLLIDDAGLLGERLRLARGKCEGRGPATQKIIGEIEDRVSRLAQQEQHQQWLNMELDAAAGRLDAVRLRQLADQAKTLELVVPPCMVQLLHNLEAKEGATAPAATHHQQHHGKDPQQRTRDFMARQQAKAEAVLAEAEEDPTADDLRDARQAIAVAKQSKVPEEAVLAMERRLAALELRHEPRLQAEERIQALLRAAELRAPQPEKGQLRDAAQVDELRELLREAERHRADPDVVERGQRLLQRSLDAEAARREAELALRRLLLRPPRTEADLEELQEAVAEGRRCGVATLHAERALEGLQAAQVQREAAEAELQEAAKGTGPKGRKRLEAALQHAKGVGVAAEKLQAAQARLAALAGHEQRCALVAGNIRRALPSLVGEPWRFQQLMEMARPLEPWTPELERLVRTGEERLRRALGAQLQQKEVEHELRAAFQQLQGARAAGQAVAAEDLGALAQLVERARSAVEFPQELLREADRLCQALKRERCQREVAEHRLRLALKARDLGEIERSLRQIRALGQGADAGLLQHAPAPPAGGGGKAEPPHSARLMEAASSMLRQLSDSQAKRSAVTAALQEHIGTGAASPSQVRRPAEDRLKDLSEVVQEARSCGVPPALIDHAKMKARERRREQEEHVRACEALEKVLSKKDAPTQEVLRGLRRVQRLKGVRA